MLYKLILKFKKIGISTMNNRVFASYSGSQRGVTVRDLDLNQLSYFGDDFIINGISAGVNDDVFFAAKNHIFHYKTDGTLIKDMTFPIESINYTGITVSGNKVFASYNGSQLGFTVRDYDLNQLSYVNTGFDINGIAAGINDDVFLASGNHIYHYKTNGTLIKDMTFPINTINYTDVTVIGNSVYASYNGSQQGFTIRNYDLDQLSYANIGHDINSIAAGPDNDLYLASANHLFNYKTDGSLIKDMNFPIDTINYTGVSVTFAIIT